LKYFLKVFYTTLPLTHIGNLSRRIPVDGPVINYHPSRISKGIKLGPYGLLYELQMGMLVHRSIARKNFWGIKILGALNLIIFS